MNKHTIPPIVGISPNAFSRVIPETFLTNYSIICFKWRGETQSIASDMEILSVEKSYPEVRTERVNAMEILKLDEVKSYIKEKDVKHLLVYKSTRGVEAIAQEMGWNIIGNPIEIKDQFENKAFFRDALNEAGITPIPGRVVPIVKMSLEYFHELQETIGGAKGAKIVFQLAEITAGGGTGTSFLASDEDYRKFETRLNERLSNDEKGRLQSITVAKFVNGIPSSIAGCVTQSGTITGGIQTQIQDIPNVRSLSEGSGLFCGHDWSFKQYNDELQMQAFQIAQKFGEVLKKRGYKGIFGIDLLIDESENVVYPVECNPRYTDAFPVLSMMHLSKGLTPLDYYHVLEHMNVPFTVDAPVESSRLRQPLSGAQIILETKTDQWTQVTGFIQAGVYTLENGKIDFKRSGYRYEDLKDESEFLLTEGVPFTGTVFKPGARILRLVTKKALLKTQKELTDEAADIIDQIYKEVALKEIPEPEIKPADGD